MERKVYIKEIDHLYNSKTSAAALYKRYVVIMLEDNEEIGRSPILQSKKAAEEEVEATLRRWRRMGFM